MHKYIKMVKTILIDNDIHLIAKKKSVNLQISLKKYVENLIKKNNGGK